MNDPKTDWGIQPNPAPPQPAPEADPQNEPHTCPYCDQPREDTFEHQFRFKCGTSLRRIDHKTVKQSSECKLRVDYSRLVVENTRLKCGTPQELPPAPDRHEASRKAFEEMLHGAMERAFVLGGDYVFQGEHQSPSQQKKAGDTRERFAKLCADTIRRALERELAQEQPADKGQISDGYHTFNELYEHRCSLFLALMASNPAISWASTLHDDGSSFDGWFIAGMNPPTGMVTYHLPAGMWSLACETKATILERAPKWDGHTAADVVKRLKEWVTSKAQEQPAPDGSAREWVKAKLFQSTDLDLWAIHMEDALELAQRCDRAERMLSETEKQLADRKWVEQKLNSALDEMTAKLAAAERRVEKLREVLRLIQWSGGGHTDEGLYCNGSWCAEQARAALAETKEDASNE